MTIHLKAVEQYFTVVFFNYTQFVILGNLLIFEGVKDTMLNKIIMQVKHWSGLKKDISLKNRFTFK